MRDSVQTMMLDRSTTRKEEYPDDFLSGQATALIGLIKFLDMMKEQTSMSRIDESQSQIPVDQYEALRALGAIRHSGQHIALEDIKMGDEEDY
jgi:hypothetical protein